MKSFAELFKQYRLQASFSSLSDFVYALSEKGYVYDPSIISNWQRGKRIPYKRQVIVSLVVLFMEKGVITSLDEANEFLESAGHGYLTKKEQTALPLAV